MYIEEIIFEETDAAVIESTKNSKEKGALRS